MGFTVEEASGLAWVICSDGGVKVRNIEHPAGSGRAAICQVDRARWITLEGVVRVHRDPETVAAAAARYAARYQEPRPNPRRVALSIAVDRVIARIR